MPTPSFHELSSSQFPANPFARAGNGQPGDEKLLQIAGPYADLQSGYPIMVTKNTLEIGW